MRLITAAILASAWLASSGAAMAQVGPDADVRVNPMAAGGSMLLYPGGEYRRSVPLLLQPGERLKDAGAITLHRPGTRRPRAVRAAAPRPARVATAAPSNPAPGYDGGYGAFGPEPKTTPAPAPTPRQQTAKAEPPPASARPAPSEAPATPGLAKRSMIVFAPNASDPAQSALGAIKFLAGDLNAAMTRPASRIQLHAFGGERGDKGSDARRLSLKRALSIRQVLIDDGVPAERIDVRAMGGVDDAGPADRVDVYIKA